MDISTLTNEEVWRRFLALAAEERVVIADLIASVAEVEARCLVKDHSWPNLFEYCVRSLHWSESAAYRRIRAARAVRRFPIILEMLRDGRLHLEGVVILHAFIEDADFASLLLKAVGLTTKGIERLVADRRRDPPLRDSIRFVGVAPASGKTAEPPPALALAACRALGDQNPHADVPARQAAGAASSSLPVENAEAAAASAPAPAPAPPRLVRIGFTADEDLHRLVLHAQRLMRHKYPDGSLEGIFRDALLLLIAKKDLGARAATAAARKMRRKNTGNRTHSPP